MRPGTHLRLLAVAALLLGGAGCVLLVTDKDYGTHCKLSGADTGCGRCLKSRCQLDVDACCRDDACSSTLSAAEGCALQKAGACEDIATRQTKAGAEGALATCAATLCGAVCQSFAGVSETTCKEPVFARGAACECTSTPSAGNDFACSPASYEGTVCCAPDSWPAAGTQCQCKAISCDGTPEGCSCGLAIDTPPKRSQCEAPPCCVSLIDPDQCSCRPTCFEKEKSVPSCSATGTARAIGCPKGQHVEESGCSRRTL